MKKLLSLVMMLVMMLAVIPLEVRAQGLTKYDEKQAKKASKELSKQGWYADHGSIEQNMVKFETGISNGFVPLIGTSLGGRKNKNTAISDASTDAITQYIKATGNAILRERIASNVSNLDDEESEELINMAESNFIKELEGGLGYATVIMYRERPNTDKPWEARVYYLMKPDKLEKALEKAANKALQNIDDASKAGNKISDFIRGGTNE